MTEEIKSFEDLKCWPACRELGRFVSRKVVPRFPPEEKFLLRAQILDSSRSSTANIAEGFGRFHHLDNVKFCSNSLGSTQETLDHLITAHDEGYIDEALLAQGRALVEPAIQLSNGYIRYLRSAAARHQVRETGESYSTCLDSEQQTTNNE